MKRSEGRNTLLVTLLLIFWEGLPFAIVGLDPFYGKQAVSLLVLPLLLLTLFNRLSKGGGASHWEWAALLLALLIFVVSLISNTWFFPQPLDGWLPSLYLFVPLLLLFPLSILGVSWRSVVNGFVIAGAIGGVLIAIDRLYQLSFLDVYQRVSSVGLIERRLVLLKTEAAMAALVISLRIFTGKGWAKRFSYTVILSFVLYSLVVISESRLAIAAFIVGALILSAFILKGRAQAKYLVAAAIIAVIGAPFALEKYVSQVLEADILESDSSVSFRIIEFDYFSENFAKTHGIGFGSMSISEDKSNFLSDSMHMMGYFFDSADYGMRINDLGILGALYQFGYAGFLLVLYMSLRSSFYLIKVGRSSSVYWEAGCFGAMMLAYMLSPIPMNFFTFDYSVIHGGLLLHLCSACYRERALIKGGNTPQSYTHVISSGA